MTPPRAAAWGISFVLLSACADDPPAPAPAPAVAVAPAVEPAPAEDKVYEVTLASTPTGARVLLSGAQIGTTPHLLKYKRTTTVQITADAFLPAEVTVDETSDPNVVVALQPDPAAAAAATAGGDGTGATGEAKGDATNATTSSSSTKSSSTASKSTPSEPSQPTPTPSTPKPSSSLPYPDVADAKRDYQAGKIDRDEYDQAVRKLKARRAAKIEVIRRQYQAGEYDKDEYNRRKRIIDNEYRGT